MEIYKFADIINKEIIIRRYPNQNNRFIAHFESAEISKGIILEGTYGQGKNPDEAIKNYSNKISGQKIIFNSMSEKRTEFIVPVFEVL